NKEYDNNNKTMMYEDDERIYDDDEEESYNHSEDEEDDDHSDEEEEEEIKKQLQNVPFGMLMEMKHKQKQQREEHSHQLQRQKQQQQQQLLKKQPTQMNKQQLNKLKRDSTKRDNKDAPVEVTAKVPVSRYKQVVQVKKVVARDPRFDNLGGQFNEKFYREKYGFLDQVVQKDISQMTKQLKSTQDEHQRKLLEYEIQSRKSRMASQALKDKRRKLQEELEQKEVESVRQGKKPFYLKPAALKEIEIKEKYKQLKEKGQLDKFMEKRRQRMSSKDRVFLPRVRRSAEDQ
ncbi:hypothetical protein SAMD00019534_118750, partial [Acytostelium subglobosum LB1]|uniref:hypothetical protein n=1 Tax=Acytostelium subglobosum LB1 TaxID=1410327 RepID=UPI000644EA94